MTNTVQAVQDVCDGVYMVSTEDSVQLAAFQVGREIGNRGRQQAKHSSVACPGWSQRTPSRHPRLPWGASAQPPPKRSAVVLLAVLLSDTAMYQRFWFQINKNSTEKEKPRTETLALKQIRPIV